MPETKVVVGQNVGLTCLTIDVLLPGPTSLQQIEVSITGPNAVKINYKPPGTYLNARRTAVKSVQLSGMGLGGRTVVAQETMIGMMHGSSCAASHTMALNKIILKQKEIEFGIKALPFASDPYLCCRDDWGQTPTLGNPNAGGKGVKIAFYRHDDPPSKLPTNMCRSSTLN